jgi:hypothetical protein
MPRLGASHLRAELKNTAINALAPHVDGVLSQIIRGLQQ